MMPHSIRPSVDSDRTFDLDKPDPAPIRTAETAMKTHSKKTSSSFGVAVTSPPPVTEKRTSVVTSAQLAPPEPQKERVPVKKIRRRSAPGTSEDYAAAVGQTDDMDGLIPGHRGAEADTLPSNGTNGPASKWKAMSYEDQVLGSRTAHKKMSSRSQRYSPVIAELRTNVIIKDEFTLITDLSSQLAQRFVRPESSIMLKIDHSACLALGGRFDPCYVLTIEAVPSQLGLAVNRRNAGLIQAFMADILSVPAERGIVKFIGISEENLAMNGTTFPSENEKAEKRASTLLKKSAAEAAAAKAAAAAKSQAEAAAKTKGHAETASVSNSTPIVVAKSNNEELAPVVAAERTPSRNSTIAAADKVDKIANRNSTSAIPSEKAANRNSTGGAKQLERPKTSHSISAPSVNGLRMNPITADELGSGSDSRPSNISRPRSIGEVPERSSMRPTTSNQRKSESTTNVAKAVTATSARASVPARISKTDGQQFSKPKSALAATSTSSAPQAPRPVQVKQTPSDEATAFSTPKPTAPRTSTSEKRPAEVNPYTLSALPTPDPRTAQSPTAELDAAASTPRAIAAEAATAAAAAGRSKSLNTASPKPPTTVSDEAMPKRRSATLTSAVPRPPPIPVEPARAGDGKGETRSLGSRLSKRKSFLRLFKRDSSVPAWYKQ